MALSRFDPFFSSNLGRDPFDDFFTSSITPWVGGQGGTLTQRQPAQPILPAMHLDLKEVSELYTCGLPFALDALYAALALLHALPTL